MTTTVKSLVEEAKYLKEFFKTEEIELLPYGEEYHWGHLHAFGQMWQLISVELFDTKACLWFTISAMDEDWRTTDNWIYDVEWTRKINE